MWANLCFGRKKVEQSRFRTSVWKSSKRVSMLVRNPKCGQPRWTLMRKVMPKLITRFRTLFGIQFVHVPWTWSDLRPLDSFFIEVVFTRSSKRACSYRLNNHPDHRLFPTEVEHLGFCSVSLRRKIVRCKQKAYGIYCKSREFAVCCTRKQPLSTENYTEYMQAICGARFSDFYC